MFPKLKTEELKEFRAKSPPLYYGSWDYFPHGGAVNPFLTTPKGIPVLNKNGQFHVKKLTKELLLKSIDSCPNSGNSSDEMVTFEGIRPPKKTLICNNEEAISPTPTDSSLSSSNNDDDDEEKVTPLKIQRRPIKKINLKNEEFICSPINSSPSSENNTYETLFLDEGIRPVIKKTVFDTEVSPSRSDTQSSGYSSGNAETSDNPSKISKSLEKEVSDLQEITVTTTKTPIFFKRPEDFCNTFKEVTTQAKSDLQLKVAQEKSNVNLRRNGDLRQIKARNSGIMVQPHIQRKVERKADEHLRNVLANIGVDPKWNCVMSRHQINYLRFLKLTRNDLAELGMMDEKDVNKVMTFINQTLENSSCQKEGLGVAQAMGSELTSEEVEARTKDMTLHLSRLQEGTKALTTTLKEDPSGLQYGKENENKKRWNVKKNKNHAKDEEDDEMSSYLVIFSSIIILTVLTISFIRSRKI